MMAEELENSKVILSISMGVRLLIADNLRLRIS
jgi:hypothetical protein